MKLTERIRQAFSPRGMTVEPLRRESLQTRSSTFGGSKTRTQLSWYHHGDIDYVKLREQSRSAWIDSVQVRAIVNRIVESAVNSGLEPEPKPTYDLVSPDFDAVDRSDWEMQVAHRFDLWARSTDATVDRSGTFYQLQQDAMTRKLIDGEVLILVRYLNGLDRINPVALQILDPDQLATPFDGSAVAEAEAAGNHIYDGIECDQFGAPVAYHIRDSVSQQFTRIPVRGPETGRVFVLHTALPAFPGDKRGASPLSPVLHELSKITDYSVAEIQAAVVNASIAAWVEPSTDQDSSRPLSGVQRRDAAQAQGVNQPDPPTYGEIRNAGVFVQNLRAGEKLHSYDTKRPNVNFDNFIAAVMKQISASLSIPVEVLMMTFSANYSASRASLLLFWNAIEKWRADLSSWMLNPIYQQWLQEEIDAGNISAPGYGSTTGRRAWSRCNWIGINHPSIDPLKEANAATVRIREGLTTRDREAAAYNGSDFADNVSELAIENRQLMQATYDMDEFDMEALDDERDAE